MLSPGITSHALGADDQGAARPLPVNRAGTAMPVSGAVTLANLDPIPVSLPGPVTLAGTVSPAVMLARSVAFAAAGDTAVWTPAAGKAVVLLGYNLVLPGTALQAAAGTQVLLLKAGAAALNLREAFHVPAGLTAATFGFSRAVLQLGVGLQLPVNAPLVINLSAALTTGSYYFTAFGYEV